MWSLEWCCKLVSKTFFLCCTHLLSICCVPETKTVLRDANKAGTKYAWTNICNEQGFPCGSASKESTCNDKDLDSIPGLGRSPGEGKGNPLQYSWASLVAQLVKNPPAMQETWVPSLGWEDPLEKGKTTHSRIPWASMGSPRVGHDWATFTFTFKLNIELSYEESPQCFPWGLDDFAFPLAV